MSALKPCPFCGSTDIDPEGWASTERKGPACMDCGASADTGDLWNTRHPLITSLNEDDWKAFAEALDKAPRPSERLKELMRHEALWEKAQR